jgi:hypothetical protein
VVGAKAAFVRVLNLTRAFWNGNKCQVMRLAFRGSRSFMFMSWNIGRVFMYPFSKSLSKERTIG